ncbi:30S ribosomal protein S3 [Candidatus Woesearchaeota archaeon]|nr:30S ribosomal protein S3 [Candidatus Woesearchaeota archaeon]
MIEREFVEQRKKEFQIEEFVAETLKNAGLSRTKLQRTPLGDKVVIYSSRPGLIVGRKGQTIAKLTEALKKRFSLENPQVEIAEVPNPRLDSRIVADRIASDFERFGVNRFKAIMHKAAEDVLAAGAVGVEIRLSGKLPSSRAKRWRVAGGYLRKCGDAAMTYVDKTIAAAKLKAGVIGIQVRVMPPGIAMPDEVKFADSTPAAAATAVVADIPAQEAQATSAAADELAREGQAPAAEAIAENIVQEVAPSVHEEAGDNAAKAVVKKKKTARKKTAAKDEEKKPAAAAVSLAGPTVSEGDGKSKEVNGERDESS